jgi:aspartyl-tRNA(Asn)/glutamyl-tRNA(Gln) amidotransferase subunit C
MSELNEDTIKVLSRLCCIEVTDEEIKSLSSDLKRILNYVSQLQEVDVSHLSAHSHIDEQDIESLRPDRVEDHLPRELFLANAPDQIGGMIRVPLVIPKQQ